MARLLAVITAVGLISCALEDPETAGALSVNPNSGKAPEGVSIQDVDHNKDGVIDLKDLAAVAYYHGQEVPAHLDAIQEAGAGGIIGQREIKVGKVDILIAAQVPYQKSKLTGNYNPRHRERNEQQANAVVSFLRKLPASMANLDYQIALIGDTCISPVITSNSQPDPAAAIEKTFWQLDSGSEGPGRNLPGGTAAYELLDNVITGLTDIHTTNVSYRHLPTAGTETNAAGSYDYQSLANGAVDMLIRGELFIQYRRLANGLVVADYYDGNDSTTCNMSWLREDSQLVIVAIDVQPDHYVGFKLCSASSMCTMFDIETTLRNLGRLSGNGTSLQKHYQLYGLTDKNGRLYNNPYSVRAQRVPIDEIFPLLLSKQEIESSEPWSNSYKYTTFKQKVDVRVDWQDFENYRISGSNQKLVDYLGDVESELDHQQILDAIASFATPK